MTGTRVLVIAASPVVRAGLESLLGRAGDYAIQGSATLPNPAAAGPTTEADVVVLALDGTGETGVLRELAQRGERGPPLVVMGDDPISEWALGALRLGAHAVLSHAAGAPELIAAIEAVLAGLVVVPPDLIGSAVVRATRMPQAQPQPLTAREIEVLSLLAGGLGNKSIAARLGISEHTVKTHVTALFAKLGVSTRAEAVAVAVRQGVLML